MTDIETRVQRAFNSLEPPANLNEKTMARIAAHSSAPAEKKKHTPFMKVGLAAAACLLVAFVGVFTFLGQASAYVCIDINPSLELGVNRQGTVVSVEGINEDGAQLVAQLESDGVALKGKSYEQAVQQLLANESLKQYLSDSSFVQFSVVCDNNSQAAALQSETEKCLANLPCESSCQRSDQEKHQAAKEAGMGVGRYEAACQLMESDPTYTLEECSHMTMSELRNALNNTTGNHQGAHQGYHHGYGQQ